MNFLNRFSNNPEIYDFVKIIPLEPISMLMDDVMKLIVAFCSVANAPKN